MNSTTCPDHESLRQLLLGKMQGPVAAQLEVHLLDCDDCSAKVDTISASDELTAAIGAPEVFKGDEELLPEAIERAKQLLSVAETVETDETLSFDVPSLAKKPTDVQEAGSNMNEEIDFLAPAEGPDEIGRLGEYRVLEVMGVGGMGVVFRAEDPKLERDVALKVMKPVVAASRSAKDRFLREAKATAAIEHDNIVHIYQVGEDRNVPFIAMQFLRGESLQRRLERDQQLDQSDVLRIGREVAAGLEAAHDRELVHRDIKPDNIWIEGATGRAKILDFGLVRTTSDDSGLTHSGMVLGTPRYMAPEQAEGRTVDHRCDLFSLGSVLYHLATGKAPFEGGNLTATLIAVVQKDPLPVDQICSQIDQKLSQLIMRLLSKDREQRPQSAAEVSQAIADIEQRLAIKKAERVSQRSNEKSVLDQSAVAKPTRKPQPKSQFKTPIFIGVITIALAAFAWLHYSGVLFKVETKDGTLIVKVENDTFATAVKGQQVRIRNTETDDIVTIDLDAPELSQPLEPGVYKFELTTDSGLKVDTDRFTIRDGKDELVKVWWEPKQQITAGSEATGSNVSDQSVQDADQRGAKWVQSINTHPFTYILIRQNGQERKIGHEELALETALPAAPFELTGVHLHYNRDITDEGLANLRDCRHLRLLHFGYTGIGDAGLIHLKSCCPNLQELHLPGGVSDVGLANFSECRELTRLSLHSVRASTAGLNYFGHCKKLTTLFLGGVNLAGDTLEGFAGCMELENLDARNTGLNPAELVHFQDCYKLKKLDISGNPAITNKELAYFQNCKELTSLNLAYADVDDNGLAFLGDCQDLVYLNVAETAVSEDFLKSLSEKLPRCKIDGKAKWPTPGRNLQQKGEDARSQAANRWTKLADIARDQAEQISADVNRRVDADEFGRPVDATKVSQFIQRELDNRKREGMLPNEADIQFKLSEHGKIIGRTIAFDSLPPR